MGDLELLERYVGERSESAFAELVRRHIGWVYLAAVRQVRRRELAEDVTQAVFIALAQQAGKLVKVGQPVSPWLFQVLRCAALMGLRAEGRRKRHEQGAAAMRSEMGENLTQTEWEQVAPLLDELVAKLGEKDRRAVLLRFYERKSLAEVGKEMGVSEAAAQKRIERTVEKLRGMFGRRGVAVVSGAMLAAGLEANTVRAADAALTAATTKSALVAAQGGVVGGRLAMIVKGALKMVAWAKVKVAAVVVAGVVTLAGGGIVLRQASAEPPQHATTVSAARVVQTDPLMQAVLDMDGWIQQEKKAGYVRIDYTGAQAFDVASADSLRFAGTVDLLNKATEATTTFRLGRTTLVDNTLFYDRKGQPIPFTVEERQGDKRQGNETGYYRLQFTEPVSPGDSFRCLITADASIPGMLRQEGKLWYFMPSNGTANCLNYYQVILPPSAVFVDCNFQVVAVKAVGNRTSVIIRNYTGPQGDGTAYVAFLWPDRDGTSVADLPPEYRGVRDERVARLAEDYRNNMGGILAGAEWQDQSTPIGALLTLNSAIVQKDEDALVNACYWSGRAPRNAESNRRMIATWRDGLADIDVLTTPAWPDRPKEGYIHPIEICRCGSLIRMDTYVVIYSQGKWRFMGNEGNRWSTDVSAFEKRR